jgi:hypothetical protein
VRALETSQHPVYCCDDISTNNLGTYLDGSLQLPITSSGDPLDHLYEYLCALDHARYHGPESEWVGPLNRVGDEGSGRGGGG